MNLKRFLKTAITVRLGMALALLCLLSACAQGSAHVTVHKNGTADLNLDFSVTDQTLSLLGQPDLMTNLADNLQKKGMKAEAYKRDGQAGLTASESVNLKNKQGSSLAPEKLPDGITVQQESAKSFFYTKQHIIVTADMQQLISSSQGDMAQKLTDIPELMKGLIQSQVQFKFLLTLPIKTPDNNADELQDNGRTLAWNVKLFEPNRFEVSLNIPNIRNIAIVGIGGLVIAAALIGLAVKQLRKRRRA